MKAFSKVFIFTIIFLFTGQVFAAKKPLKILFMLHSFPTLSATFVMGQITGLIDRGHDVYIFACTKSSNQKIHPDIERYKLLDRTYYRYLPADILTYDILYCQFFSLAKRLLPRIIRLQRTSKCPKFVVCCRGSDGTENVSSSNKTCQQLFECTDLFLSVCSLFKEYLIKAGCDSQKICVHHDAINLNKFQYKERKQLPGKKDIILISVARLVEKKGIEYAIHALAILVQDFPQLRYIIIGDGPKRKRIQQLIENYNLNKHVLLLGWCMPEEIINYLTQADFFIHPALTSSSGSQEGIPTVLMEAMAMGLPIVSTFHGGIPELVENGISGFLVSEKDAEALCEKIKYLIEHSECWQKMGMMGRMCVEREHDIEKENDKLERIFYQLFLSDIVKKRV